MSSPVLYRLLVDAEPLYTTAQAKASYLLASYHTDNHGAGPVGWVVAHGETLTEAAYKLGHTQAANKVSRSGKVWCVVTVGKRVTNVQPVDPGTFGPSESVNAYEFPDLPDLLRLLVDVFKLIVDGLYPRKAAGDIDPGF